MIDLARYAALPFVERGRSAEGVDCWGLVWLIYGEVFGLALPEHADDYALGAVDSHRRAIAEEEGAAALGQGPWLEIAKDDHTQLCDLIVFELGDAAYHLGLCLGALRRPASFLHIEDESGVHIAPLRGRGWGQRTRRYYRHKDLAHQSLLI